jgi:hypothetical protein
VGYCREGHPYPLALLTQGLDLGLHVGPVPEDLAKPHEFAGGVPEAGEDAERPDAGAVLAELPAVVLRAAVAASDGQLVSVQAAGQVLRREHAVERLAEHLGRGPAEHVLGGGQPGRHAAL